MNIFTKNSFFVLSIFICNAITAMEQESTHTLMISTHVKHAAYATPDFHSTRTPSNLPSTIKDPIIRCTITNTKTKHAFCSYIAAKYLLKPEIAEPLIEVHQNNQNNHHFKITARCVQNPKLRGNDFLEQLRNTMTPFYEKPSEYAICVYDAKSTKKEPVEATICNIGYFKKAQVLYLHKTILNVDGKIIEELNGEKKAMIYNPSGKPITGEMIWGHGPNGCPDEETLLKSIMQ